MTASYAGHLSPSNHITSNCCVKSKSGEITGLNRVRGWRGPKDSHTAVRLLSGSASAPDGEAGCTPGRQALVGEHDPGKQAATHSRSPTNFLFSFI